MFTNFDAQHVLSSNRFLESYLETMKYVKQGSGETEIHKWALKVLLEEILSLRTKG